MADSVRKFKETIEIQSGWLTRIRQHRHFGIALISAALIFVACVHIWQRVYVIRLVQEVDALKGQNAILVDETKKAKMDVAALTRATRITTCAAESLGLQPISVDRLYTISLQMEETAPTDSTDELAAVVSSIKRVADYLPVMSEAKAGSSELRPIKFDSIAGREDMR
jgi:cell division protein FtsL